jgi:hypothetical protein
LFEALKERWGFKDGDVRTLRRIAKTRDLDLTQLANLDMDVIRRLGWSVKRVESQVQKWSRT